MNRPYLRSLCSVVSLLFCSLSHAQENPPLFGAWGFDENALEVGVGERWRFNAGDAGNSFANRNGRLEYEATQEGIRLLGWVSPSSAFNNFHYDWAAEVTVANETKPASGFTYAGLETYVLSDNGGGAGNSAYYSIFLRADATGRYMVAERGLWNAVNGSWDRFSDLTPAPDSGAMRLRMVWRAGSRALTVYYSFNGDGYIPLKTFDLQGAEAPLSHPWSDGMGIELSAVNRGGAAPVNAGEILFDDMYVYAPETVNPPLYGSDDFSGAVLDVGIGKRWRFNAGDSGNSLSKRDGRLEYEATQDGVRWLGWVSPSSADGNYLHNWTAETTVTNDTTPASGFTYAGIETYVLLDSGGNVGSNAYYGIYLRSNPQGRAIVADWGIWNPSINDFNRSGEAVSLPESGPVRLRLSWDAASQQLSVAWRAEGAGEFTTAKVYDLAGAHAPLGAAWMDGMGLELAGVSFGGAAPVSAGQITFDDVQVYGPARNAPLFASDNFNDNLLPIGVGERWRFTSGGAGNAFANRNGRLEFDATQGGLRWLGWVSPSSAFENYDYDWRAEVTIANNAAPVTGFVSAGLEAYLLSDSLGSVGSNAYYGIYQSNFGGGRSIVSEFGIFNPQSGNFEPEREFYPLLTTDAVRVRLTWRHVSKTLELAYSTDKGASYTVARTYLLDGEDAPMAPAWSRGFGLQLLANNGSGVSLGAGEVSHDNMAVYAPAPEGGNGFFGRDDFVDGVFAAGRYAAGLTTNGATWMEAGGQINFIADASSPAISNSNQAQQTIFWSDALAGNDSYLRSWSAEADFSLRRDPVSLNGASFLGMEVVPAGDSQTYYGIYITHATSGARVITIRGINGGSGFNRRVLGSTGPLDPNFLPENVRLRISYDAVSKVLASSFSLDGGSSWQDYSTFGDLAASNGNARDAIRANWPVEPVQGFGLRLYGALYGDGANPGPVFVPGDATVRNLVVRAEPRSFEHWQNTEFTASQRADAAISARPADPDADGISNFHAYVYGLDPLRGNDPAVLPQTSISGLPGSGASLVWSFQRAANPYLLFGVHASSDLNQWSPVEPQLSVEPVSDGLDRVTIEDTSSLGTTPDRFLRLDFTELR